MVPIFLLAFTTNLLIFCKPSRPEVERSEAEAAMPFLAYFLLTLFLVSC